MDEPRLCLHLAACLMGWELGIGMGSRSALLMTNTIIEFANCKWLSIFRFIRGSLAGLDFHIKLSPPPLFSHRVSFSIFIILLHQLNKPFFILYMQMLTAIHSPPNLLSSDLKHAPSLEYRCSAKPHLHLYILS